MKFYIVAVLLFLNISAFCQRETVRGNQQWFQYYNSIKISEKFGLYSDAGIRWKDTFDELSQTLLRTGVGYNFNKEVRVISGFAFLTFRRDGDWDRFEYRPYQEVSVAKLLGKVKAQHRFRVEERFFRSGGTDSGIRNSFNYRFRYRFYVFIPIGTLTAKHPLYLNVGDEILFNAGKDVAKNIFDSNRLLIGPAIQLNSGLNISLTYNYTYARKNQGDTESTAHIIWLGFKHKLNLVD